MKIYKHGEVIIKAVKNENAKITGKEIKGNRDLILADSETTGNHHMLQVIEGVHTYRDEDLDKFFVRPEVETKIYCKLDNRHTDLILKKGYTYEIEKAKEWDHLEQEIRNVRD